MAKRYVQQWEVPSHTKPDQFYVVSLTAEGVYECSCPYWIFNTPRPECKHIRGVKGGEMFRTEVIVDPQEQQKRALEAIRGLRRSRFEFVSPHCGE